MIVEIREPAGIARDSEPVFVGIPCPKGILIEPGVLVIEENHQRQTCQQRVLSHWPDGSIKWLLLCFTVTLRPWGSASFRVTLSGNEDRQAHKVMPNRKTEDQVSVQTADAQLDFRSGRSRLFSIFPAALRGEASTQTKNVVDCRLSFRGQRQASDVLVNKVSLEEKGPVFAAVMIEGTLGTAINFSCRCRVFLDTARVSLQLTLHNPARARHEDGYWNLGDPASVLMQDVSILLETKSSEYREIQWINDLDDRPHEATGRRLTIYQDSSGGEHWDSPNHRNRNDHIPHRFRGYQVACGEESTTGHRASPVVVLRSGTAGVACSLVDFWQRFPSAIEVEEGRLRVRLLPEQFGDLHELQAGERMTRVVWFQFFHKGNADCGSLAWSHQPLSVRIDAGSIHDSGAIPFLPAPKLRPCDELATLLSDALASENSFYAKRETIDEYGWRNYGDVWADHETAFFRGSHPIISHDNNQYDLLHGFLIQYLLSGDERWWSLVDPLAQHVMDIDIYHTDRDKAAYSGGMFWHTAHYQDAGRSSHRSYCRTMRDRKPWSPGGGPSNEHNYTSGLLLYHFLTGDRRARQAVIELADYVVAMDDGTLHPLGLVCDEATGLASNTREPQFHGPGRGAGNSINALLDGWQASGRISYLRKAEELIRRTIHPRDDVAGLGLLDAENKWSYTVYLQSLGRFFELTRGVKEMERCRCYSRAALLHYARWMLLHERLTLDHPDGLEYPTETWAAQDLRKGNVLLHAAWLASDRCERAEFRRRGTEILDAAWRQLVSFPTRNCTRPLSIVLQQGYIESYLRNGTSVLGGVGVAADPAAEPGEQHPRREAAIDSDLEFAEPLVFIPQKSHVAAALGSARGCAQLFFRIPSLTRLHNISRRSWMAQRLRLLRGTR